MIRKYEKNDSIMMMELIEVEGEDWSSYYEGTGRDKYLNSLEKSITYVKIKDDQIVGYIRAIDDFGFDVYICDLLVSSDERGHQYGYDLIQSIISHFSNRDIYVMSDVDLYYIKQGFKKIGSIFKVE
jgi:predicted GNAT family N-acyltransferase